MNESRRKLALDRCGVVSEMDSDSRPAAVRILRARQYQQIIQRYLHGESCRLFQEVTGLCFEILWRRGMPATNDGKPMPPGCVATCKHAASCTLWPRLGSLTDCIDLPSLEGSNPAADWLVPCPGRFWNYAVPLVVAEISLGYVALQARENRTRNAAPKGPRSVETPAMNAEGFCRAVHLLEFIVHYSTVATLAEIQEQTLGRLRQKVVLREKEFVQSRAQMSRAPSSVKPPGEGAPESPKSCETVHRLLEYIHGGYAGPISLKEYAAQVRMNPAYLSARFSSQVGVSFKRYLIQLRMEKAKELLRDPRLHITDVAYAVGYTDANRFQAAFKTATDLSPTAYRALHEPD